MRSEVVSAVCSTAEMAQITAMIRPYMLFGTSSPYPTVVNVITAQYQPCWSPRALKPNIGHNIGLQAPIGMR